MTSKKIKYNLRYDDGEIFSFATAQYQPSVHFVAALLYLSVVSFGVGGLMWI